MVLVKLGMWCSEWSEGTEMVGLGLGRRGVSRAGLCVCVSLRDGRAGGDVKSCGCGEEGGQTEWALRNKCGAYSTELSVQ